MKDVDPNAIVEFTLRRKIILTLFCIAFPIMVWGVMAGGWWFPQMAASFLTITIVIMFISGLKEKEIVNAFTHGASELVAVSLIIGMARGVNLVLEEDMISDAILNYTSQLVSGMPASMFILGQLVVFIFLGLVVPSSSGLAVLAMPIMAPRLWHRWPMPSVFRALSWYPPITGGNMPCSSSHRPDWYW